MLSRHSTQSDNYLIYGYGWVILAVEATPGHFRQETVALSNEAVELPQALRCERLPRRSRC